MVLTRRKRLNSVGGCSGAPPPEPIPSAPYDPPHGADPPSTLYRSLLYIIQRAQSCRRP